MEIIEKQFKISSYHDENGDLYAPELKKLGSGCRFTDADGTRTVVVMGDSLGYFAYPQIAATNAANNINTAFFLYNAYCWNKKEIINEIYNILISKSQISDVLIILRGLVFLTGHDFDWQQAVNPHALYDKYEPFLQNIINNLVRMGKKVYIVGENPVFPVFPQNFVSRPFSLKKNNEFPTMTLAEVREHQKPYLEMLGRLKNAVIIDSLEGLCPDGICRMFNEDGLPLYYDENHLSYDLGGRLLVDNVLSPYLDEIANRP
ncbi:MAG: hypothetical protein IJD04_01655 [Desulfovibrionaceae bacterium]|nr:hypothetical protein [Desulfovibrionaceae bacterium]